MFDEWRIKSVNWDWFPILTFSEVPEVEIVLINRPDLPALGAGEPATVTTAAASPTPSIDATGARLRQIPSAGKGQGSPAIRSGLNCSFKMN